MGKWKEVIKQFFDGAVAGFFSVLIIFIINQFITTMKRMVRIIKEGFLSLNEMIGFFLNPPKDLLKEEIHQQVFKMDTTVFIIRWKLLFEEVIEKFLMSNVVTAPVAKFLATILTGMLTVLTLVIIILYGINKIDIFGAKEKRIEQQLSSRIMEELWSIEKEIDWMITLWSCDHPVDIV